MPNSPSLLRIAQAYVLTRQRRHMAAGAIETLQRRSLLAHPGHARHLVAAVASGEPLQALLDELPQADPVVLRRDFQFLNCLGLSLPEARACALAEMAGTSSGQDGYSFGLSTGSEGAPGVFITSPEERARYVGTLLAKLLAPSQLFGRRIALLLKHDNKLYRDASRSRTLALSYYDISNPLDSWIAGLVEDRPDIVIGPPSVLLAVAGSPTFASQPLRPVLLLTGAEPTFPADAHRLEAAYGVVPRPVYQACEGFIGLACPFGTLHVNDDSMIVEWRRFRFDDAYASPVITDFSRRTQDVRRVLMPDVVRLRPSACPCGSAFQAVDAVEGRFSDVLYAFDHDGSEPHFVFPFALDVLIREAMPEGGEWRIEQDGADSLAILTARALTAPERADLANRLFAAGGWTRLRWERIPSRPAEVKRRRFIRRIDPESRAILHALEPPRLTHR